MIKYTVKRVLGAALSLFIIITAIFILLRLMPVEGYLGANYDKMKPETRESLLREKGLLDPLPIQLFNFYGDLLHGDLGTSWIYRPNVPITKILSNKITVSATLGIISMALSLALGIPLGAFMALKKGKILDKLGTGFIVFVTAVPAIIYYLLLQLSASKLFSLPILFSRGDPKSWVLPIISMSLGSIAGYAMWMRRYMLDQMNQDYVKQARAKGVSGGAIMMQHVFKNAFVPMAQFIPGSILFTIIGSIYVEHLYSVPGTGGLLIDVIQRQDNTMVQALVLIYSSIGIIGLFLGDLLMGLIDPRIRLDKGEDDR